MTDHAVDELRLAAHPPVPVARVHTLVVGAGAAGLNAAAQLHGRGVTDLLVLTEGLRMGTSINTGSDKQTYYKLSLCGDAGDSPRAMAADLFAGGSMHGDLALVEAAGSAAAFLHLVHLGLRFPRDRYGQFVGYKTDHDPRARATSIGPYTSRAMCLALQAELARRGVRVRERMCVAAIACCGDGEERRACGVVAVDREGRLHTFLAENLVLAVGGPGGLFRDSVYPVAHTGAIGLALEAGAAARGLPLFQFGIASTRFRWNVSGSYMQVIPRLVSTAADGESDAREFLRECFADTARLHTLVFLKGYQWPFDPRKVENGSSLLDLLVYRETVERERRVFLDFRSDPEGLDFARLHPEARDYLRRCGACIPVPLARLEQMNPRAAALYREHGIDLGREPLEVAVCAQHNNGGLAADHWWESENLGHLFPVGEVNGSHGLARPGGSALNAGQVGGMRAAEFIAARRADWSLDPAAARAALEETASGVAAFLERSRTAGRTWREERGELQARMSACGGVVREAECLRRALAEAWAQWERVSGQGCSWQRPGGEAEAVCTRHLVYAHCVYLDAMRFSLETGAGSRGSALVLDAGGRPVTRMGPEWRFLPEDESFRARVLQTIPGRDTVQHRWQPRRPLPQTDTWFETAWSAYERGELYER